VRGCKKIPALRLALDGCLLEHHRFLLSEMIEDLDHGGAKVDRLEQEIEQQMQPFQEAVDAWLSAPAYASL
jgi:transposase